MSNQESDIHELKTGLLQYWIQITKTLNDDFEEIAKFGENSDIKDILNSLFMVEEARMDQIQNDKEHIKQLQEDNESLKQQIANQGQQGDQNNEFKDLQKQYREAAILMLEQNRNIEQKEQRIQQFMNELEKKNDEIRYLEKKVNELSLSLVESKEQKIKYMEQAQNQIQQLKEKELKMQYSIIEPLKNETSRKASKSDFDDIGKLSLSSPLRQQTKKVEQVQGSSFAQYRFGK